VRPDSTRALALGANDVVDRAVVSTLVGVSRFTVWGRADHVQVALVPTVDARGQKKTRIAAVLERIPLLYGRVTAQTTDG